jgi:ABC-type nickel/cobalt efflux system permease component RcnA
MLGLDQKIVASSHGASVWAVLALAALLGLRHATDPDHLVAVTTLVAGGRERATRRAVELGLAWGIGHATTLFAFGVPILLLDAYLPQRVEQAAETAIGGIIIYLALRLLVRWRRGELSFHAHPQAHAARTRRGAFAIGLLHGMSGSAGVAVLILASGRSMGVAVMSLVLFAAFTVISMTVLTRGFATLLARRPGRDSLATFAPTLGAVSLLFGVWYATAAWGLAP